MSAKISDLTAATEILSTDEFVLARSGANYAVPGDLVLGSGVGRYVDSVSNTSTRTLTATSTWEDIASTEITFTARANKVYLVTLAAAWRSNDGAAWLRNIIRAVVDGATTGVTPTQIVVASRDSASSTSDRFFDTVTFSLHDLTPGSHTVKFQSQDDSSGMDRSFDRTHVHLIELAAADAVAEGGGGGIEEHSRVEFTSSVSVTSTTEAGANDVVSAGSVDFDGTTPVKIEFFAPRADLGVQGWIVCNLWDGGTDLGRIAVLFTNDTSVGAGAPLYGVRFLTPTAGSHEYKIKAWRVNNNGSVIGGTGAGAPANMPGFIRVTSEQEGGGGGGGSGETIVKDITQTAHGLAVGDWVRLDGADYVVAQADTVENAESVGVVSAVADANTFSITTGGYVEGLTGLVAGDAYFLSASAAGEITDTEPAGDGDVSKPVLLADTSTSGWVINMRGAVVSGLGVAFAGVRVRYEGSNPSYSGTAIEFNTEEFDTDGFHDNVTNNSRLTVPTGRAGYYHVGASVRDAATSGGRAWRIKKNGTQDLVRPETYISSANYVELDASTIVYLDEGDYVEVIDEFPGAIESGNDWAPVFWMYLINGAPDSESSGRRDFVHWPPGLGHTVVAGTWTRVTDSSVFQYHYFYNSSVTIDDEITIPVDLSAGTWRIDIDYVRNTNTGICTFSLDGVSVGTIDTYGSLLANQSGSITGISVAAGGRKTLSLKIASKNGSSSGYRFNLANFQLTRTA